MNRVLILSLVGALLGGGVAFLIATADEREGPIFIASDQAITESQVREKLQSQGWLNVQIAEQGQYLEVTGIKGGRTRKIMINSLTGRLIQDDDDD
jgi:hypothetical protein